ncbi:MAG TPA: shikimate dehydrogenase [Candidatus Kapabacteria bacterium]|nr:shikimate dehydrogenase [Candidatus Kapabacteria bacterium]
MEQLGTAGRSAGPERLVLIGANIAHSRSPRIHNHLFTLYSLPYRYDLMPLDESQVVAALAEMKRGGYRGANVTSPHKRAVLPAIDALSPEAARIGAVNTIVIQDGRAIGHNTDAAGFTGPLRGHAITAAPFSANVLGTGGAAMAAVHALLAFPTLRTLTIYSRDADRARNAAARWEDGRLRGAMPGSYSPADLLVNATPIGLPASPGMPIAAVELAGTRLVYEMVYSPPETSLAAAARAAAIEVIGGQAMFVAQALRAFQLWTGIAPQPEDVPADLWR